jgi:predicted ATPase/class 3 adenylate cyclase
MRRRYLSPVESAAPSGIVTLLFTDIEGSTRIARELGEEWGDTLALHHEILERAIRNHRGWIDGTEGDAFFATFDDPREAVAASVEAQRELRAARWPRTAVRVRMGMHTGSVRRIETGYVGLSIHRAARVAAAAQGGQVLLTSATRHLLDEGDVVEDLGEHRLKDFPEPERLFHLVIDERGADAFPPPKTLAVRPTNIPVLETPLVGRREELSALRERLTDGYRVVTLTGQGGAGKTRLALAAAEDLLDSFPGGAWFVPLADYDDAKWLLPAIAEKLELADDGEHPLLTVLADHFAERRSLLVLDNVEQLRGAANVVSALVAAAPKLRMLVTSQGPLRISTEYVLPLAPLSRNDGTALFIERARMRGRVIDSETSAGAIAAICDRLDGLPLAIELAAARTAALSPEELSDRLDRALPLLTTRDRDRPDRHRSLRAAIEWSYELLDAEDRELFARLSLFATPFTLADAEAVCGLDCLDGVEELLDHSFLRRIDFDDAAATFTIAQTLRQFGREQLSEHEWLQDAQEAHGRCIADLAERAHKEQLSEPVLGTNRIVSRLDDGLAALEWAREHDPPLHLRLAGTVGGELIDRGAGSWVETDLQLALDRAPERGAATAQALVTAAWLNIRRGESEEARRRLTQAKKLWLQEDEPAEVLHTLNLIAWAALADDSSAARAACVEALDLARTLGDEGAMDEAIIWMAQVDVADGRVDQVEPLVEQALTRVAEPSRRAALRHFWADCALLREDGVETVARYADAIQSLLAMEMFSNAAVELEGLAMGLALASRSAEALEVDQLAQAIRDRYDLHQQIEFWEKLRKRHLGDARRWATPAAPALPAHPSDADLADAMQRALALADTIIPKQRLPPGT